jgi:hypothetical protein
MNEFSGRKPELAAGLNMENDSGASKPDVQVLTSRLSSAYPHLSSDYSPSSDYSRGNLTQASPQHRNLSRLSTTPQNLDEDGTLGHYAALPLPSSSQTNGATLEPRDVPLPTEDLSDDEQDEGGGVVSPTHKNPIE